MRDESCPVCGEDSAWDGDECKVCGFVAPPDKFGDPDVDMHKKLDLRNNDDLDGGDVADLNADTNDRDGDGFDDNTGEPITDEDQAGADDVQPMLSCPSCGYEVEAGEPVSTNTADPTMGDAGAGPAAGDLCPNCGKAPLESPGELTEEGMPAPEDAEQDPAELDAELDAEENPEQDPNAIPDNDDEAPGEKPFADDGDEEEDDEEDGQDDEEPPAKKPFPPRKK